MASPKLLDQARVVRGAGCCSYTNSGLVKLTFKRSSSQSTSWGSSARYILERLCNIYHLSSTCDWGHAKKQNTIYARRLKHKLFSRFFCFFPDGDYASSSEYWRFEFTETASMETENPMWSSSNS